ncbi:MAG: ECF-type sigma factor [bacterium]
MSLDSASESFAELLRGANAGQRHALDQLIPIVFEELKAVARRRLRANREGQTVNTTELVHEAYIRLAGPNVVIADRIHFFALAARIMRQILVDRARARGRGKRGGHAIVESLDSAAEVEVTSDPFLIDLDRALEKLRTVETRPAQVIEMVFFGGLTQSEVAEVLGVSASTVERELRFAKRWLRHQLGYADSSDASGDETA